MTRSSPSRSKKVDDTYYDDAAPHAACLVESLRAFGYELPTALADLVDNAISASARHVWIDFHWDGDASVVAVTDDGMGMEEAVLVAAMRPGSQNPLQVRAPNDLGRFGLGLKTASFSQCRRLTVRSRSKTSEPATRCWDLDHVAKVDKWQLLRHADAAAERHFGRFNDLKHGTTIVWQQLDRLTKGTFTGDEKHQEHFYHRAEAVRRHLGMVFHQLMVGKDRVSLLVNGREISPWDPFLADEPATQTLAASRLKMEKSVVLAQPFVLPHHTKMPKAKHEAAAGPRGWTAHQGFYVYRNRRLLVPGDWLGFGWAKEEHYKLARIRVEIPNTLDHEWQIDVTKSRAAPPAPLREELRRIGERARSEAKRVYSHRGAKLTPRADSERVLLWEPMARHDKTFYRLNREHPLLKRAYATSSDKGALDALLRIVEETVPLPHIMIASSELPNSLAGPFELAPESQVRDVMKQAYRSLIETGYGGREAVNRLRTIWPFELFPALLEALAESPAP